jgi:hypothetical protein
MLIDNLQREKESKREGYLCFFWSRLSKLSSNKLLNWSSYVSSGQHAVTCYSHVLQSHATVIECTSTIEVGAQLFDKGRALQGL